MERFFLVLTDKSKVEYFNKSYSSLASWPLSHRIIYTEFGAVDESESCHVQKHKPNNKFCFVK